MSESEHKVVSREEWDSLRADLLKKEKHLTKLSDTLASERQSLPWVKITKSYTFQTPSGPQSLLDLFNGKSQLFIYHFMLGPGWKAGCPSCSFWADNFAGMAYHLPHRDVAFTMISRAPLSEIETYKKRMNWEYNWVSSAGSEFNFDMKVSEVAKEKGESESEHPERGDEEKPGISVFVRRGDDVFLSYCTTARGLEGINAVYGALDMVPKGRDERSLLWSMAWVKRHDEY